MSQDTHPSLSQVAQEIDSSEVAKAQGANERVSKAYGADSKGLIVVPVAMEVTKTDELY